MRLLLAFFLLLPLAAAEPGFVSLFDGKTLDGWFIVNKMGPGFLVRDGLIVCPYEGGQKLMTNKEYANFVLRLEYKLEQDGNNGIGIRPPATATPPPSAWRSRSSINPAPSTSPCT